MNLTSLLLNPSPLIHTVLAKEDPGSGGSGNGFNLTPKGTFSNLGGLTVQGIISGLISLAFIVVVLVFFFMLVLGGIKWITANGDEKAVGAARSQITNAFIGLIIVFATWAIVRLIGYLFSIDIFQLSIPTFS